MLKTITTLSEKYANRDIYVWELSKDSVTVFGLLAFHQIDISGIVTVSQKYVGKTFLNRKIVISEEIENKEKAVIVLPDNFRGKNLPQGIECIRYSEMLDVDKSLYNSEVFIYGAGYGGRLMYDRLQKAGVEVKAFCVSQRKKEESEFLGKPVLEIDEIACSQDQAIVVSVIQEQYRSEILDRLQEKRARNVYIEDVMPYYDMWQGMFMQAIYRATIEGRDIYLYSKGINYQAQFIKEVFQMYQINIRGYVHKNARDGIRDVYELAFEDPERIIVIINENELIECQEISEILESIGFSLDKFNYVGTRLVSTEYKNGIRFFLDPLLGASARDGQGFPGVRIGRAEDGLSILVLGGSTSTERVYRTKSWPYLLHRKLQEKGIRSTIYNMAHCSNGTVEEILRLIRDGYKCKPDFVISMSGVNNTEHITLDADTEVKNDFVLPHMIRWMNTIYPERSKTYGVETEEDVYDFWVRTEKILETIATSYEAKFLCFLQPMRLGTEKKNLFEECMFNVPVNDEGGKVFRNKAHYSDFYTNLLSLFDEKEGMFIDYCHYTTQANEILADIVCNEIIKANME
ncbi:MAG: SGNH/GDSL hydrolase family protein [Lachnospiraceae bacterium]|nr:SGNH/GDSL hydrolase family protein [Lachnospiraceae bacterium]